MREDLKWKQMYEDLWKKHKDLLVVKRVVYEEWVVNHLRLQLLKRYAEENPTTETCEMLDILNAKMPYGQAKDKLKELEGGKYDIIGYGFSYEEKQDDN